MNKDVIFAVFKRNLASYFGSPSGYVFICAFLLASGLAAFWPQEFFDSNLANLDQLNKFLPYILLGFVPAITMSIWADERRQGTDELLLTIPGSDFDVVLGKYFGAVAIYTVSIFFSFIANYFVLSDLGRPDLGLLISTYVGYFFVGLSMLAIGMVASFLTSNLTVAFVLGVAFNAPLALSNGFAIIASSILGFLDVLGIDAEFISTEGWGLSDNFLDFSRGIISLSSIVFFVSLAIAAIYLCSILIGRRHWAGSPEGKAKAGHYSIRVAAGLLIATSITYFFRNHDVIRIDATEEQLSSLSDGSIDLLKGIEGQIEIDAFISPADAMPEQYVQTRINLLTALREIDRESKNVLVNIHEITPEDNASVTAEKYGVENQNGINPPLFVQEDGRFMPWQKDLYLGLVFKGGGTQQTIPFLYKGLPVEYEIMRTLSSVNGGRATKKKLGVFTTDAPLMGSAGMGIMGFNMGGGTPAWEVISELRKQYDVQEVTGGEINKGDYDALLVVQPNNLDNEKMNDLLAAIKSGIPTAIFEDPLPLIQGGLTGTFDPRRNNQGGGGPGQPPPPAPEKGDLNKLWDLLGVHFNVNPKERLTTIINELNLLQINAEKIGIRSFQQGTAFLSKLEELVKKASEYDARLNAGASISSSDWDSLKLDELRKTLDGLDRSIRNIIEERLLSKVETRLNGLGKRVVRDPYNPFPKIPRSENFPDEFVYVGGLANSFGKGPETSELQYCLFTCPGSIYSKGKSTLTFKPLLSSRGGNLAGSTSIDNFWTGGVFGTPRRFNPNRTEYQGDGKSEVIAASITGNVQDGNETNQINVILVADSDVLADPFFNIRSRGPDSDFPLDVDNVTLCLNLIDKLSGENSLLEIRNRRRLHRTLEEFEKSIEAAREVATRTINEAEQSIQKVLQEENRKLNEAVAKVQGREGSMSQGQFLQVLQTEVAKLQKNLAKKERELRKESEAEIKEAERNRDLEIKRKQEGMQKFSVFLPPLPLLIIAAIVFYRKRKAEIQGAVSARVRA